MAVVDVAVTAADLPGLAGPTCRSVRVTSYRSVDDQVEVPLAQARFATIAAYDGPIRGNRVTGNLILTTTVDMSAAAGPVTRGTVTDFLTEQFGP